jgi:DNA polymerase-3 subunit epsilon
MSTATTRGIWDLPIATMPVAVLDFETTGLFAGYDRVVEVSIVRCDPGDPARLIFDTLIHPGRPMNATFIHGLTDVDVLDAPKFADIAGLLIDALAGCVVAAYNVGFDIQFLRDELGRLGIKLLPPQLCLMYLRPLLGFGKHCKLEQACRAHCVSYRPKHTAASDAWAAAGLWQRYRQAMIDRDLTSFRDLADLREYRFTQSFRADTLTSNLGEGLGRAKVKPRSQPIQFGYETLPS